MKKSLLLLRHARSANQERHRFLGRTDASLDETGHRQAAALRTLLFSPLIETAFVCRPTLRVGESFDNGADSQSRPTNSGNTIYHWMVDKPQRCFCSPLKRCLQTADALGIAPEIDPDLREIDFGRWEGKSFDEIQKSDPAAVEQWASFDPQFSFPEGERLQDFLARVRSVADRIAACPENPVLAVTHAGVIRALLCHFLGLDPRQYVLFDVGYASLTTLDLFDGKGVLTGLNLRPAMEAA